MKLKAKKILIISKYASTFEVGFETRIATIARNMQKFGNEITIITSDSNHFAKFEKFRKTYNVLNHNQLKIICIKTLKYKKTISLQRVLSWIDFEIKLFFMKKNFFFNKPDVVIVSSLSLITIINGIILKLLYNCKLVFEIRDIWPLVAIEEGGYSKYNPLIMMLAIVEKMGYKYSDLIVGTMPNLTPHVQNVTNKKYEAKCIPFGYEFENLNYSSYTEKLLKYKSFIDSKFTIAYAGSIGMSNGLETFVSVIKKMKNNKKIGFVFLGDGSHKIQIQESLKNNDNVIFIPKVQKSEVQYFLKEFNVLYFSSLKSKVWDYGWSPNKIIDYMVSKRPIIASYSGFKSMINEARCGEFVEAENESVLEEMIIKFSKFSNNELNNMGERGMEWIKLNRNWTLLTKKYLKIIDNLFHK